MYLLFESAFDATHVKPVSDWEIWAGYICDLESDMRFTCYIIDRLRFVCNELRYFYPDLISAASITNKDLSHIYTRIDSIEKLFKSFCDSITNFDELSKLLPVVSENKSSYNLIVVDYNLLRNKEKESENLYKKYNMALVTDVQSNPKGKAGFYYLPELLEFYLDMLSSKLFSNIFTMCDKLDYYGNSVSTEWNHRMSPAWNNRGSSMKTIMQSSKVIVNQIKLLLKKIDAFREQSDTVEMRGKE